MEISKHTILKNLMTQKKLNSSSIKNGASEIKPDIDISESVLEKNLSIKSLLDSLFRDLSTNQKSKDTILQILQNKNIPQIIKDTTLELSQIIKELKNDKTLKSAPFLDKILLDIDKLDAKKLQTHIEKSGIFLESKLAKANTQKSLLPKQIQETLIALKNVIKGDIKSDITPMVDKLLNAKKADKEFFADVNRLIQGAKVSKDQAVVENVARLENLVTKSKIVESKLSNNQPMELKKVKENIQEIVLALDKVKIEKPEIKEALQELNLSLKSVQNVVKTTNPEILKLNISEKIQRVVNIIKNDLVIKDPQNLSHVEVAKLVQNLEKHFKSSIQNREIFSNQKLQATVDVKTEIMSDIKANLLHIKDEISHASQDSQKDTLVKVDKVLTNINYYQLLSLSSGANILYLPLLWDGLDEGQVSIKKLKQKRYFCEINLKLKDFGKIDLLIMLFDEVNINISIFAKNIDFLNQIRENLQFLKQGINSVGLIPSNVYLYDYLKDDKIKKETKKYIQGEQIGMGISLHV